MANSRNGKPPRPMTALCLELVARLTRYKAGGAEFHTLEFRLREKPERLSEALGHCRRAGLVHCTNGVFWTPLSEGYRSAVVAPLIATVEAAYAPAAVAAALGEV